jgi:alkanesulfonate monooxygenase SsuD/methylene tetrahydromethanopterin reductase-like flavin-dependent oxidoreductase (luciferase family)
MMRTAGKPHAIRGCVVAGIAADRPAGRHRDNIEEWFRGYGVDGFLVHPPYLPGGIEDFVDLVIPELQSRGLFRAEYEGATLRENLGFERPKSGYAS